MCHCARNSHSAGELCNWCSGGGGQRETGELENWSPGALFNWKAVELMKLRTVGL